MKNHVIKTALLIVAVVQASGVLAAPGDVKAVDYDVDANKTISSVEYAAFLRDQRGKTAASFDVNGDNQLDAGEMAALNAHLTETNRIIDEDLRVFNSENPGGQPIADFAVIEGTRDASNYKDIIGGGKWLVRASHEDITVFEPAAPKAKVKGATVQLNRDIGKDETTRTLTGVLMRPVVPKGSDQGFFPSLSFNQVRNKTDRTKNVDVLNFRVGYEKLHYYGADANQWFYRITPVYSTDSHIDSRVPGIELQTEFAISDLGMGTSIFLADWLEFRWRGILHYEYGKVVDAGKNTKLTTGDKFSRLGPKLKLEFWFPALERFSMAVDYTYLNKLGDDSRDRKFFNTAFNYQLDDSGNLTLQAEYKNGDASLALEDEERFTLGLGLKF